ncbi:MAG: hypothetical protein JJE08_06400 [Proteiniphilum sp.]|nr:hypothetical protein [Proteiniphilum sp.]
MKTLSLLAVMLTLSLAMPLTAQDEAAYTRAMEVAIDQFDKVQNAADLQVCKNSFERIAGTYDKQWLPTYYAAYLNTELAFWEMNSDQNSMRLEEAEKYLKRLEEMEDADKSEVENLWGYYYMCRISQDPETMGQQLFQPTITKLENAMTLNPENPRPVILLAFFEQNLPSFLQSKRNRAEDKIKAEALFSKEQKNYSKPYWGKYFLQMINTDSE